MGYGLVDANGCVWRASCWKNIHNQTISNTKTETGCIIDVQNTTVTNTGRLDIHANERVIINDGFKVMGGGSLTIK